MSGLKFGTSGLRGLVSELAGAPARQWTAAFLRYLDARRIAGERIVLIGRDLRASSPAIAGDCITAALHAGWTPVDCGALPTPALALAAQSRGAAAIMVTGSHIPENRNGLKFYTRAGEITKDDEDGIRAALKDSPVAAHAAEASPGVPSVANAADEALEAYRRRYLDFFAADALTGVTAGVYQQSAVARDLLVELLESLGARVVPFGRATNFIPVDTEAHRPEDLTLLRAWAKNNAVAAIVSTDGDADRPLVADSFGAVLRGDLLGLLTAKYLGFGTVVTPITSSAAVETSGVARNVLRTKVGSPFVIAAMVEAERSGATDILGFEANGGVLLGSPAYARGRVLAALPTRDAMLPIICTLALARREQRPVRAIADRLGVGHALSDRLTDIGADKSRPLLQRLGTDAAFASAFVAEAGQIASTDTLDGVRFLLGDGSVVHFRASGNAPELRCYVESATEARANHLLEWGLRAAALQLSD